MATSPFDINVASSSVVLMINAANWYETYVHTHTHSHRHTHTHSHRHMPFYQYRPFPGTPGWASALTNVTLTGTTTGFLWAGCPSCHSTCNVKTLQDTFHATLFLLTFWATEICDAVEDRNTPNILFIHFTSAVVSSQLHVLCTAWQSDCRPTGPLSIPH